MEADKDLKGAILCRLALVLAYRQEAEASGICFHLSKQRDQSLTEAKSDTILTGMDVSGLVSDHVPPGHDPCLHPAARTGIGSSVDRHLSAKLRRKLLPRRVGPWRA
jgi:hypothetical protein